MADQAERLVTLIGDIYQAGMEPDRWPRVLAQVCDEFGAIGALMGYYEPYVPHAETFAFTRLDPDLLQLYHEHYVDNPWTRSTARYLRTDSAIHSDRHITLRDIRRSAFYADILQPQNIASNVTTNFLRSSRGVGGISLMFAADVIQDTPTLEQRCDLVFSHLRRALELGSRLNLETTRRLAGEAALDQLRRGVLIIGGGGKVVFANTAADRILGAQDGLAIANGSLWAQEPEANRKLVRTVGAALNLQAGPGREAPSALWVPRNSGRHPYVVLVLPLRSEVLSRPGSRPAALCFLTDPHQDLDQAVRQLAVLYGFTAAEARIVMALSGGQSLPTAARALGVKLTTARTHLQHVFDKTGVRSQTALVQLISHLARSMPLET